MKKRHIYLLLAAFALILSIMGWVLVENGDNGWIPGIYVRQSFGYLGYVDEPVHFEIYYYLVGDTEDSVTKAGTTYFFDSIDGFDTSADLETSYIISSTTNYVEKKAEFTLDLSNSLKEYISITLFVDSDAITIDIGDIVIEHRSFIKDSLYNLDLQFGLITNSIFDITIQNRNMEGVTIFPLDIYSSYIEALNNTNYVLTENGTCILSIQVNSDDLDIYDIVYIKPIIEFQRESDLESIPTTIFLAGVSMKNLNSEDVYQFSIGQLKDTL